MGLGRKVADSLAAVAALRSGVAEEEVATFKPSPMVELLCWELVESPLGHFFFPPCLIWCTEFLRLPLSDLSLDLETTVQPSGSFSKELVGKVAWLVDLSTFGSGFGLLVAGKREERPGMVVGVALLGVDGTKLSIEVSLTKARIDGRDGAGLSSPSSSSLLVLLP